MERILVFIPVYNCAMQIQRVLCKFDATMQDIVTEILIVDNQSKDGTLEACKEAMLNMPNYKVSLIQNAANYNLGGSHKVAFNYALMNGYDYIVVLHGDDQGDIRDILSLIRQGKHRNVDCLLGARFMSGSRLLNYSWLRTFGNVCFNALFSIMCWHKLYDLGAGLNMYKVSFLKNKFYLKFPNALTFNYYMLLYTVAVQAKFVYFPLSWREEDQVSNVKLFKQTRQLLNVIWKFFISRHAFITDKHEEEMNYSYNEICLQN